MKPKQLLILVAVLAVLGLVAFIAGRTGGSDKPDTAKLRGQDVLEGWDINAVAGIEVKSASGTVSLSKPDNIWLVEERNGFPADRAKVENTLRRIWKTPVMQAFAAGASQDERMELLAPDAEGDDEKKATKLTFKGKDNSEIGHVLIGKSKTPSAVAGATAGGASGVKETRYLRTTKDATLVLEVPNGFNEELSGSGWPYGYGGIEADPGIWLNKEDFIKVQKIASIAVNYKEEGNESYSLSREDDTGDFTIAGDIPIGKELDASKVSGLKTILSNASFEDLLTEEEATKIDEAKVTEATLTTFEGFTYKILIGEKDADKNRIPVKFAITGELPTERVAEAGKEETEEDKAKADADFQTKLKENQDKLAEEKALESHWFTLSSFRVDPLLKSRPDLLKDEEKEEGEVPSALAKPPGDAPTELPPGLDLNNAIRPTIEAVSEPVAVPPLTKGATATTPPIEIPRPPKPPVKEEVKEEAEAATEAVEEEVEAATEAVEEEVEAPVENVTKATAATSEAVAEKAATTVKAAVESATETATDADRGEGQGGE